jgi:hypothetical protein
MGRRDAQISVNVRQETKEVRLYEIENLGRTERVYL